MFNIIDAIILILCATFATTALCNISAEFSKANKTLSEIENSLHAIYEELMMKD